MEDGEQHEAEGEITDTHDYSIDLDVLGMYVSFRWGESCDGWLKRGRGRGREKKGFVGFVE